MGAIKGNNAEERIAIYENRNGYVIHDLTRSACQRDCLILDERNDSDA